MDVDGDEQELPSQQTRKESPRTTIIPTPIMALVVILEDISYARIWNHSFLLCMLFFFFFLTRLPLSSYTSMLSRFTIHEHGNALWARAKLQSDQSCNLSFLIPQYLAGFWCEYYSLRKERGPA